MVDEVLADSRAGIAVVRPPGHHAEQVGKGVGQSFFIMLSRTPFISLACRSPYRYFLVNNLFRPVLWIRIRICRLRMFLGLLDPVVICIDPDPYLGPSINKKKVRKKFDFYLFDFLSLKTDVYVPSKSNKTFFLLASCQPLKKAGSGAGS